MRGGPSRRPARWAVIVALGLVLGGAALSRSAAGGAGAAPVVGEPSSVGTAPAVAEPGSAGAVPVLGEPSAGGAPVAGESSAAPAPAAAAQSGWFHVIWIDGPASAAVATHAYVLMDDHGAWTQLDLDEATVRAAGGWQALDRRRVRIVPDVAAAATSVQPSAPAAPSVAPQRVRVRSITLEGVPPGVAAMAEADALGPGSKPWATILCRFADSPATPRPKSYYQQLMSATAPGLDHYWREVSDGQIDLAGSVVKGWYTLPQPRSYYIYDRNGDGTPEADGARLLLDCAAAADPDVFFPDFYGLNLMFSADLPCIGATLCSFASGATLTKDGETRVWAVTWNSFSYQTQGVVAHEMGHGFGLPHSSGPYAWTYDSGWDVMSKASGLDCTEDTAHPVLGCVGVHTIAYHKDRLGWIPPARKVLAPPGRGEMILLERLAQPEDAGALLVQIPINGSPSEFYTLESRRFAGYDERVPGEAVVIHRVDTERADRVARVVDPDGNGNANDGGAMWGAGDRFVDAENGITVTIGGATATGFQVTVGTPRVASVSVKVNSETFGPGDRLTLQVTAQTPAGDPPRDLYVGALAPDGETVVYFAPPGAIGGVAHLDDVRRLRPAQVVPGGSMLSLGQFFSYTFPAAGIPTGAYWVWAALVRQGTLGDNAVDDGDVVAFHSRPLVYSAAAGPTLDGR